MRERTRSAVTPRVEGPNGCYAHGHAKHFAAQQHSSYNADREGPGVAFEPKWPLEPKWLRNVSE